MSRTAFAVRFKALAGVAPLSDLTQWRMQLARHALEHDPRPLSSWVEDLGYGSENAFSHAFKRVTGDSPNQYRRRAPNARTAGPAAPRFGAGEAMAGQGTGRRLHGRPADKPAQ